MTLEQFKDCFPQAAELAKSQATFLISFRRKQEEARKEAMKEAAKPSSKLKHAYFAYMVVKKCYDVRLGYQMVYINDIEMERARLAVREIETSIQTEDPSINTNDAWQQSVRQIEGSTEHLVNYVCRKNYSDLVKVRPYSPPVKDF